MMRLLVALLVLIPSPARAAKITVGGLQTAKTAIAQGAQFTQYKIALWPSPASLDGAPLTHALVPFGTTSHQLLAPGLPDGEYQIIWTLTDAGGSAPGPGKAQTFRVGAVPPPDTPSDVDRDVPTGFSILVEP